MSTHACRSMVLALLACAAGTVFSDDRRIGEPPIPLSAAESRDVGERVCGPGNHRADADRIYCLTCPPFTGDAGDASGMVLSSPIRGRLLDGDSEQLLFDTSGCEPHFEEFGGALLVQKDATAAGSGVEMLLYRPGFRLDDCLRLRLSNRPTLLVCNEEFMAQGEIVGHLSEMQVSRKDITRWRLVRWYDNSGGESDRVLRIVPTRARAVDLGGGRQELRLELSFSDLPRRAFEGAAAPPAQTIGLRFERAGDRLFPDPASLSELSRLEDLMARYLDR